MRPAPGEAAAGGDGLGPLVLVVGEGQVDAAAVQVEALAQQVERHDDAFGVPPRPARAPWRLPPRLARLGRLPEHEVDGRPLAPSSSTSTRAPARRDSMGWWASRP